MQLSHVIYLKNILLVGVQNELEGLIPHRIHIVIEMLRSLPAIRGRWDEQLHIRVWSVNYRAKPMFKLDKILNNINNNQYNYVKPHITS